jgi:hypothetical protein
VEAGRAPPESDRRKSALILLQPRAFGSSTVGVQRRRASRMRYYNGPQKNENVCSNRKGTNGENPVRPFWYSDRGV